MIKQIGTKIYYCNITGNVIKIIGDMQGYVKETSIEEDFLIYEELNERNKESIGLLTFEYGEYPKLSKDSTGVMVDLETKELVFAYEELPQPPQEPNLEDVMKKQGEKISTLEQEQETQNEGILLSMLSITEMYELNMINARSINEVPKHIQATYQKLFDLKVKSLDEIPYEVRKNLKAK